MFTAGRTLTLEGCHTSLSWYALGGSIEQGLAYGVLALGVYLTFRVLHFADLTVDGSFPLGAAVAATLIVGGMPPDRGHG